MQLRARWWAWRAGEGVARRGGTGVVVREAGEGAGRGLAVMATVRGVGRVPGWGWQLARAKSSSAVRRQPHVIESTGSGSSSGSSSSGGLGAMPTFVSSHYRLSDSDVTSYLSRKGLVFRETPGEINVKACPFCKGNVGRVDNQWKLYFKRSDGACFCHRCGFKGSWFDFKAKMGDVRPAEQARPGPTSTLDASASLSGGGGASEAAKSKKAGVGAAAARAAARGLDLRALQQYPRSLGKSPRALKYLTEERGLSVETLQKYSVGVATYGFPKDPSAGDGGGWQDHECVTFPWVAPSGRDGALAATRIKVRALSAKHLQRLDPKGGGWSLFGWQTVPDEARELVVTEGEYDAMAVWQATGRPAVSLPNGARSLPVEVLPMLERFERIVLWMDDDMAGMEGAEKLARKLGVERTYLVRPSGCPAVVEAVAASGGKLPKDANDALRAGLDMDALVVSAARMPHKQIVEFSDLRSEILTELSNPEQACGVQSRTLPALNKVLKGHRKGELTILTGPTGAGKTSILSQLSLDYAAQGVPTLWGSFELSNVRLVKKMMQQLASLPLEHHLDQFDYWADAFEALPMHFMKFFGSSDIHAVLDAMEYAVYVNDVEHIVLDNLQFMHSGQGKGFERFELLDKSIEALRKFATEHNVHISLVVHPRKVDDDTLLNTSSVFGTAKATQEADNVIIIQRGKKYTYLDIRKNRFDGDLGIVPYTFDKSTCKIRELDADAMSHFS
ncbi:helicase twinkle [Thecamonas trahens ATCC 50062]|uniref:Helicase twinkle n=1 Tax=Thecamonas trahens ATCC 50062 TaxID=461836 RepID=A0A0L0D7R7_THETB|nr:helicase twinkle [Thecamonas trahens ATCC 50062]KNC48432.1 helicase twinkle [Thecamonas trahens ATCC 50062]|eukprot:XP_013758547.1 helicase twinkle [Thecamonas trahens ATCC 50062]